MPVGNMLTKREKMFRTVLWCALEFFTIAAMLTIAPTQSTAVVALCAFTTLIVTLPFLFSKILKCEFNIFFFSFLLLYAIGPMLGYIFNLYFVTTWWDDLLHLSGGVVFAAFGLYLVNLLNKNQKMSRAVCLAFAVCFSIAISAIWEFIEYGIDVVFHSDLQNDTIIKDIYSYLPGGSAGNLVSIEGIESVIINGIPMEGYIDIGLHDTMSDMLIESGGAVVFALVALLDKERHPLIYMPAVPVPDEAPEMTIEITAEKQC